MFTRFEHSGTGARTMIELVQNPDLLGKKWKLKDGPVVVLPLLQFMKTVATADAVFANS
jgi:hypothetical protein